MNHDAFGLAVLIFQLLMQGRHPFAGIWRGDGELPIERAIAEGRFAYGGARRRCKSSGRRTCRASTTLTEDVASLFERAFARFERRPTPREWVSTLDAMCGQLVVCPNQPGHQAPSGPELPVVRDRKERRPRLFRGNGADGRGIRRRHGHDRSAPSNGSNVSRSKRSRTTAIDWRRFRRRDH